MNTIYVPLGPFAFMNEVHYFHFYSLLVSIMVFQNSLRELCTTVAMPRNMKHGSISLNAPPLNVVDASQVHMSPFFVHSVENLAAVLVSPPLDWGNYNSWSHRMRRAMITKNKHRFVDHSFPIRDTFDPSFEARRRCNNLVHSWIWSSVTPPIA